MANQNLELLEARADLATFLDQLPTDDVDHEVIQLLADMNRGGSLAPRWDKSEESPTRLWYPVNPDLHAHRIFAIRCDKCATFIELFLCGQIEFSVQKA